MGRDVLDMYPCRSGESLTSVFWSHGLKGMTCQS